MDKDEILEVIRSKVIRRIPSVFGLDVNLVSKTETIKDRHQYEKEIEYSITHSVLLRIPRSDQEHNTAREAAEHLHSFLYGDVSAALYKIRATLEYGDKQDAINQVEKLMDNI